MRKNSKAHQERSVGSTVRVLLLITLLLVVGLLLLSPGLALFLFGISSSAEHRTFVTASVLVPTIIGAILIVAFIVHALRKKNPLLDLRLFANRTLSISVITMVLFMVAFFGAALLFPQYFIGVRGESTLTAGLLLARA